MKKNYFLKTGLMLILAAVFSLQGYAQSLQVSGNVVDASGLPITGVTVIEEGTANGVVTGIDGEYSIRVASSSSLSFSFVGYETVSVAVAGQSKIDLTLKEDVASLEEVVVVGYGVQKKSHLTGSIASVATEGMTDVPATSIDQLLIGKSAGLMITNSSGQAGESASLSIRGMGSVTNTESPLVVVDGYPMDDGLNMVNAADIESIEILKDAASSAIYGSRAAGGVILITTKSGSADAPSYNVKVTQGLKYYYKEREIYTEGEYNQIIQDEINTFNSWAESNNWTYPTSSSAYDVGDAISAMTGYSGTMFEAQDMIAAALGTDENPVDWQEVTNRDVALYTNVQASVSGGSQDVKYYISGNYAYNESMLKGSDYTRMSIRAKIDAKISDRIDVGVTFAPRYSLKNSNNSGYNSGTDSWMPVYVTQEMIDIFTDPTSSVYIPGWSKEVGELTHNYDFDDINFTREDGTTWERTSPVVNSTSTSDAAVMDGITESNDSYSLNTSSYINIKILDNLIFRSSNGFDFKYGEGLYFQEENSDSMDEATYAEYSNSTRLNMLSENTLSWFNTYGKHDINVMVGYTAEKTKYTSADIAGYFGTDYVSTFNAATEIVLDDTETSRSAEAMESYLARLIYSYDGKYLMSASWRADGSSKFGQDNRYGYFPSVSVGWRISEEKWMKDIDWIDQLKIRASYGITGSDNIDNYASYNTVALTSAVLGSGTGSLVSGYTNTSGTLGNTSLTWEQTNEFNVGFDLSVLGGRLNVTVDAYDSKTQSLLMEQAISTISGYNSYYNNIGQIQNQGIEIEVGGVAIKKPNFTWQISGNIAFNKNTLLDIGGPDSVISDTNFIAIVGEEAVQYYLYKTDGVYASQADCDEAIAAGDIESSYITPGTWKLITNGDGTLDADDMYTCGSPFADYTWGLTNNLRYKNFDFAMVWQGVQGLEVMNTDTASNTWRKYQVSYVENRWFADAPGCYGDGYTAGYNSKIGEDETDACIEDGSYMALRSLTLGYTLPSKVSSKLGLKSLRVYLSGQNLLYFWSKDFSGINPESRDIDEDDPLVQGEISDMTPIQSTISIGLDINF